MSGRRGLSVRARLVLLSATLIALALLVFAGAVRLSVERILVRSLEDTLRRQADNLATPRIPPFRRAEPDPDEDLLRRLYDLPTAPQNGPQNGEPPRRRGPFNPPALGAILPPRVIDLDGRSLSGSDDAPIWSSAGYDAARGGDQRFTRERTERGEIVVFSRPRFHDGRLDGVIQCAATLSDLDAALAGLTDAMLLLLPIAVMLAALAGAAVTDRILQPVRALTDAAARIEADRLDQRLPVHGDDEFGRLGGMLNGMLERLRDAFERQRRFTADASHELRTPLAVIKTTAEIVRESGDALDAAERDEALRTIEQSADRATRLVRDLLLLARGDRGTLAPRRETLALAASLEEARRAAEASAATPRAPIAIDVSPPDLTLHTDPDHLARIVGNLLDNALRHTPADGRVRVRARTADGGVEIAVEDTGEGIAPEHQERLGEAFYRPDAARSRSTGGAGLGLAICTALAHALGGTLSIRSEPGRGTTVTLTLPA